MGPCPSGGEAGLVWIFLYAAILFGIGLRAYLHRRLGTVEGFVVYNRSASGFPVAMSLVALVFGASSVFGMAGFAYRYGVNALWWTLSGAIFLVVLRFTFLDQLVRLREYTISDLVARVFGENLRGFVSAMIALAWLMVLAGQIIAGGTILTRFVPDETAAYLLFTASFALYTLVAGQAGAMKTGTLQVVLMAAGLVGLFAACLLSPEADRSALSFRMGFSGGFTPGMLLGILVPVGLAYLFGPDIYSRIFTARDEAAARWGVLLSAGIIVAISLVIVSIGMLGRGLVGEIPRPDALIPRLVPKFLSGWKADLVVLSLVSIPLSGADIILMTIGTLWGRDLVARGVRAAGIPVDDAREVTILRGCIAVGAAASAFIALRLKAIIPTLLIAYKVFSIGIVPLVFVSLLALRKGRRVESATARIAAGSYLLLSSVVVVLAELSLIPRLPAHYNLVLLGINTACLLAIGRIGMEDLPAG